MQPIVYRPLSDLSAQQGQAIVFRIPEGAFRDDDLGDSLRYSITLADGSALPDWLHFDALRGVLTGLAPYSGALQTLALRVTATDNQGQAVSDAVDLRLHTPNLWLMAGQDAASGRELWVSDGTSAGTRLLKDIMPGSADSNPAFLGGFHAAGSGKAVFTAEAPGTGRELWVTDGTAAGTQLLRDIQPGLGSSNMAHMTDLGDGHVLFTTRGPDGAQWVWVTDGSPGGTMPLNSFAPNVAVGQDGVGLDRGIVSMGDGHAMFLVRSPTGEVEPWITDGTVQGTQSLAHTAPLGTYQGVPIQIDSLGDGRAVVSLGGTGVDPTVTMILVDGNLHAETLHVGSGGRPSNWEPLAPGQAVFGMADAEHGQELWVTDGTAQGTHLLKDLVPGVADGYPRAMTALGDGRALLVTTQDELWVTDGTEAGTRLVSTEFAVRPELSVRAIDSLGDGRAIVNVAGPDGTTMLYASDGTSAGTMPIRTLLDTGYEDGYGFAAMGDGRAMLSIMGPGLGWQLITTDGTAQGTTVVDDASGAQTPLVVTGYHQALHLNAAPVGMPPAVLPQAGGQPYVIREGDLLAGVSDPDGGPLTVRGVSADVGTLVDHGNATWSYTAPAHESGVATLRYQIVDLGGATLQVQVQLPFANGNVVPQGQPGAELPALGHASILGYPIDAATLLQGFTDPDGDPLDVAMLKADHGVVWDLGGGQFRIVPEAGYVGGMTLSYQVVDGYGASVPAALVVQVDARNAAPVGVTAPELTGGIEDQAFTVSAATLLAPYSDADGDTLTLRSLTAGLGSVVDHGDGTYTITPAANAWGLHALEFEVVDGVGGVTAGSRLYQLAQVNDAPVGAPAAQLPAVSEDATLVIPVTTLLQGFTDVDNPTLEVRDLRVDHGQVVAQQANFIQVRPDADYHGTVFIDYLVVDASGAAVPARQQFEVVPVNDNPAGSPTAVFATGMEDTPYSLTAAQLLQGFADVDGDTLAVEGLRSLQASVADLGDGRFVLTPMPDVSGDMTLYYNVIDGQGGAIQVSRTIGLANVNDAPTGRPDGVLPAVDEDGTLVLSVAQLTQGFTDVEDTVLQVSDLRADHGTVVDAGNGFIVIQPDHDYVGPLVLDYQVVDSGGLAAHAIRSIDVLPVNDAPTGPTATSIGVVMEDTVVTLTAGQLLQFITDVDGDVLSVASLVSDVGTITALGDGQWTLRTPADHAGNVVLAFDAVDGHGGALAVTRSIFFSPVNDAPTGSPTGVLPTVAEDGTLVLSVTQLTQGFTDVEDATLQVRDPRADHGTVVDAGNGFIVIQPDHDYVGPLVLGYQVVDSGGLAVAASRSIDVLPVNDAPVGPTANGIGVAPEDTVVTVTAGQLLQFITDVDGDVLSVANLRSAAGIVADLGNGQWSVQPPANHVGDLVLSFDAVDGHGGALAVTRTIFFSPVNDAPSGASTAVINGVLEDQAFTVSAAGLLAGFGDVDGDALRLEGLVSSTGSITDLGNGSYRVTPASNVNGAATLQFDVVDTVGARTHGSVAYAIAAVNDAPTGGVLVNDSTPEVGQTLLASHTLADADGLGAVTYRWQSSADGITWTDIAGANTASLTVSAAQLGLRLHAVASYVDGQGSAEAVASAATSAVAPQPVNVINGTAGNDNLVGTAGIDQINGLGGNDTLDGRAGADRLAGGAGNDTYVVDDAGDVVVELAASGTDLVTTSVNYTLGDNLENLRLLGTAALTGTGNAAANVIEGNAGSNLLAGDAGNDRLVGNAGNDILNGGTGADTMLGGAGDDTYYVDAGTDVVTELAAEGWDKVIADISYTLGANVEELQLGFATGLVGAGNALDNILVGGLGNNTLNGLAGADRMNGGAGNDTLIGGAGADTLTGGSGADVFGYTALTDSGVGLALRDLITDFASGSDRIDLSALDANTGVAGNQAFALLATPGQAFTGAGQLHYRYETVSGQQFTVIEGNVNANLGADFQIALLGTYTFKTGTTDLGL